jgi:hypothetical protein
MHFKHWELFFLSNFYVFYWELIHGLLSFCSNSGTYHSNIHLWGIFGLIPCQWWRRFWPELKKQNQF